MRFKPHVLKTVSASARAPGVLCGIVNERRVLVLKLEKGVCEKVKGWIDDKVEGGIAVLDCCAAESSSKRSLQDEEEDVDIVA